MSLQPIGRIDHWENLIHFSQPKTKLWRLYRWKWGKSANYRRSRGSKTVVHISWRWLIPLERQLHGVIKPSKQPIEVRVGKFSIYSWLQPFSIFQTHSLSRLRMWQPRFRLPLLRSFWQLFIFPSLWLPSRRQRERLIVHIRLKSIECLVGYIGRNGLGLVLKW